MDEQTTQTPPTFPPRVRTWTYGIGAILGLGVAPSLLAYGLEEAAVAAGAVAGACNALALGYRPTR